MRTNRALRSATARRASALKLNPAMAYPPVRKIITKKAKRVIGYLSSVKMCCMVPWESQLEFDCLRLMEADNSVTAFFAQPELLRYRYEGFERRYYPDLRVEYADGAVQMVEVKYQDAADDPDNKELFAAFTTIYAERGITYRVMTENDIRRQPLLANAKLMMDCRDCEPSEPLKLLVAEVFTLGRPATLGELEAVLAYPPERRGELFGMALRGYFDIDLEKAPLSAASRITSGFRRFGQGGKR